MKSLNKIKRGMENRNPNVPYCNGEGSYFNLMKSPVVLEGYQLYECECGRSYGVKSGQGLDCNIKELKRLSEIAGKSVTIITQEENGLWFSDGFLDF